MGVPVPVIVEGEFFSSKKEAAKEIHSRLKNYNYGYNGIYKELQSLNCNWTGEVRGIKIQILPQILNDD